MLSEGDGGPLASQSISASLAIRRTLAIRIYLFAISFALFHVYLQFPVG